jgi:hypothetical protein
MVLKDDSPLKLEPFERVDGGGNSLEAYYQLDSSLTKLAYQTVPATITAISGFKEKTHLQQLAQ